MTDAVRSRRIAARPEAVWAVLADFGAISTWAPQVTHSSILREGDRTDIVAALDGGVRDDLRGLTRRVQIGSLAVLERVVHDDEGTGLGYEIEGLPKIVHSARNTWRIERAGPDATDVTLTSTVDCGTRPPQKLIARIVARRMARDSAKMLEGLAHTLERTHA